MVPVHKGDHIAKATFSGIPGFYSHHSIPGKILSYLALKISKIGQELTISEPVWPSAQKPTAPI